MVHLPTVKEQEEFREKNLERLLEKYNRGYVVYYNGPHNTYEHYRTETDLRQAYPYLFDSQFRASTNPLVIDIKAEKKIVRQTILKSKQQNP